jgi:hypothetical protein
MGQPNKRATRARKCKCKCHIRQSLEMRKKANSGTKNGVSDTIPTKVPSNSAVFRVKIKRK